MKKIAVLFSGYPRFVRESYPSIEKNFLSTIGDFDIFANLQWDDSLIGKRIHHEHGGKYDKNELEEFVSIYSDKIKKIRVNKPFEYDTGWLNSTSPENNIMVSLEESRNILYRPKSQYQGISDGLSVIDNINEYSHVVRMRTDLVFNRPISPDEIFLDMIINQNGYCAGYDRHFSDWFFSCPIDKVNFFHDLADLENHFKNGVIHMHKLVEKVSKNYQMEHRDLKIDIPSTDGRYSR